MRKLTAILLLVALLLCGCGEKETAVEQTTVKGMVVSVDGTKVELMSTDNMTMGGNRPSRGEGNGEGDYGRPQGGNRPEGDFTMPEDFTIPEGFEGFNGQMPEGFNGQMPEGFNGQMPEGFGGGNMPNFGDGNTPSFGGQAPEGDFTWPEGDFTMPEGFGEGEMPTMPEGFGGGNRFNSENLETTAYDLKDAHISVEIEGGKASGTMADITVGSRLTLTLEGDKVVNVLVSQSSFGNFGGFGGGNMPNFGGFGGGNRGERPNREQQEAAA